MRKYRIPKAIYVLLVTMLLCVSVGYTYAYFSSTKEVSSTATLNNVSIRWVDYNPDYTYGPIISTTSPMFDDANSISLVNELKRGSGVAIVCYAKDTNTTDNIKPTVEVCLGYENLSSIDVYCRIKITATYKKDGQDVDFNQYLKLANKGGTAQAPVYTEITNKGWVREGAYYYYKSGSTLTAISAGDIRSIADSIVLDASASADMYGASVKITLTLEAVQSTHNAYQSVWK